MELERTQFMWLSPCTGGPNPTFHPGKTPQGEAAVQQRVRAVRTIYTCGCDRADSRLLLPGQISHERTHAGQDQADVQDLRAQVAVFWSRMGKWYRGRVTGFSTAKAQHEITYSDGDVQWLDLRQEAVMWPDVPGLQNREELAQLQGLQGSLVEEAPTTSSTL